MGAKPVVGHLPFAHCALIERAKIPTLVFAGDANLCTAPGLMRRKLQRQGVAG